MFKLENTHIENHYAKLIRILMLIFFGSAGVLLIDGGIFMINNIDQYIEHQSNINSIKPPPSKVYIPIFLILFSVMSFIVSFIVLFSMLGGLRFMIIQIKNNRSSAHAIFIGYIEISVIFSIIYFYLNYFSPESFIGIYHFENWYLFHLEDTPKPIYKNLFLTYFDCLHYSIVTQTTLGYGDMVPQTITAKLLTDVQVLMGIYLVVIAIAQRLGPK